MVPSYKRSASILIKPAAQMKDEYGLKHHFFDPMKSSPPNIFMRNLQNRVQTFHSQTYHLGKKEDKRVNE